MGTVTKLKVVSTDASTRGWRALHEGKPISGLWTETEKRLHINCLEMKAVALSLRAFLPHIKNHHVLVRTDNMSVVAYINRQGGLRSHSLHRMAKHLLLWAEHNLSSLRAAHVPVSLQAPRLVGESVQKLKVEVQGSVFRVTKEWKTNPSTIQDKRDNHNNRIGQWTNVSSTGWILQLSHKLNPEAQIGMYTIKAFIGDRMISHVFVVKKYVLPKFDVTANTPQTYSVAAVGLKVEACAKYTYGQPVPGQVLVEVCREPFSYVAVPGVTRRCLNKTAQMNATVCAVLVVDTSVFFGTTLENYMQVTLLVNVTVTEEGTDVVMSKSAMVSITFEVGKVTFVDLQDYFEPGLTNNGKVNVSLVAEAFKLVPLPNLGHLYQISVSRFDGTPIASKAVYLLDGTSWPNKLLLNLTTNQNGLATISLNTANLPKADLNLVVSVTPVVGYGYKSPYFTTDTRVVQLTIVTLEQPLKCGAVFPVTVKYSFFGETGDYSADIVYMVSGHLICVLVCLFSILYCLLSGPLQRSDCPSWISESQTVQILVYCVLPSENVVAATVSFETERCFQNQVSLRFSPATAFTAEGNVLTVSAQAGSLCGLSAVDQSVRILEPGRRLSAEMWLIVVFLLQASAGGDASSSDVTIRTYFPETWFWQLAQVGATGSTQVPLAVPDTITTWETDAFCLSSIGFGLAPPALLTVFQPFFLELSLPYSIVKVTPASSTNFTLTEHPDPGVAHFLSVTTGTVNVTVNASAEPSRTRCGTEAVTVPSRGRVDVVTRSLLVLPEGVERTNTQSWLLCPKGDIMGRSLKNLDELLQMPSGCGEQNMIILAPNIYVLLYLKDTVVALHALSVYAAQVFSLDSSSTVTVQSSVVGGDSYSLTVNRDNRLLYQEKPLKNFPGKYSVKASGSVQIACFYNIPTPVKVTRTLSVEAAVKGDCQRLGANLKLNFIVKYNGVKASTNMVIVDIKLLSGFTADTSPLGSPPQSFAPLVERVDADDDHVLVYLKEVPQGVPMSYTLRLNQVLAVKNLKPAVINIYDYYQPSDAFETTYTSPCP
ncbi:alpha-2-macroglobulin-like protein 1 [Pseudorasbora parva]|uniref:alpha-2-macroglobulin-like protein 1 n=1 Tax=Pseudorasbora parva TaxID=51549 RepID=UPI00351F0A75